jgi:anti-anti-sigma factor
MTSLPDRPPYRLGEPRSRYVIDCAGAQVHVHARRLATVLRVEGEIDASNADLVTHAIRRFIRLKAPLVLDVSQLDFLGVAGLRALLLVNEEHRQARLHCNVVSGAALRRLTSVATDHGLPVVDSVPEALRNSHGFIHERRQLLSHLARQREPQHNTD